MEKAIRHDTCDYILDARHDQTSFNSSAAIKQYKFEKLY